MKYELAEKRLFLALPIDPVEPSLEKMQQLKKLLRGYRIKWVEKENMHLTLFFFGEVVTEKIPVLRALIRSSITNCKGFDYKVSAPGLFKNQHEPRILWLGIDAPNALFVLKQKIDETVKTLGFETDNKKFRPHLTMGRFAPKQTILPQLQAALNDQDLQNEIFCTANKVILFESKLTPNGPIYSEIEVFTLQ